MLPKTGSTSLAELLESPHEWHGAQLLVKLMQTDPSKYTPILIDREKQFREEFGCNTTDVCTVNFMAMEQLCHVFPSATFYHLSRNVYTWVDSFIGYSGQVLSTPNPDPDP